MSLTTIGYRCCRTPPVSQANGRKMVHREAGQSGPMTVHGPFDRLQRQAENTGKQREMVVEIRISSLHEQSIRIHTRSNP